MDCYQKTIELVNTGSYQEAEACCQELIDRNPSDVNALRLLGYTYYSQNDFTRAEDALLRAIKLTPNDVQLLYNLGFCQLFAQNIPNAIKTFEKILKIKPDVPEAYLNLGNAYISLNDLQRGESYYSQAVALRPDYHDAIFNLGTTYKKMNRLEDAERAFRKTSSLNPTSSENLYQLAVVLQARGKNQEAIATYKEALKYEPDSPRILYNLGVAHKDLDRYSEAVRFFKTVVAAQPENIKALNNLGITYHEINQMEAALEAFRRAIAVSPEFAEAYSNMGNVLLDEERFEEAVDAYAQAIAADPTFARAYYNLGCAYQTRNEHGKAVSMFEKAIAINHDFVEAHWNMSHSLLLQGGLQEGFNEYLWRWRRKETTQFHVGKPEWNGEPAIDKTLLVITEQGLGDSIQFIRYLPQVKKNVGKMYVACEPSLTHLFDKVPGIDAILEKKSLHNIAKVVDYFVPLLNLPTILGTTLQTIPNNIPYLRADQDRVEQYADISAPFKNKTKIGFVWQGSPTHKNDKKRSCSIDMFASLFEIEGTAFFSLQKQDKKIEDNYPVINLAPHLSSFADTAALIDHLDLVISVDTSVAHLAGAMGKPTWLLLPYTPDWRWLLGQEDSPWYPTMRLFRQKERGDWEEVFSQVHTNLLAFTKRNSLSLAECA